MKAELRVRKTIEQHGLIEPGDSVILGLSGGPDSLCLLHVLSDLRRSLNFSLSALHVNHLMRGEQASADVEWLSARCRELRVPFTVSICDVYAKAREEGISPEEAGRKARHGALKKQKAVMESCCAAGCGGAGRVLIALAHNRDDQAETVLMRIIRGTGVHGLGAMEYIRSDGFIRPLLDAARSEIEEYCERHGLSPRYDSTNGDTYYTRNKLRLQLIPQLEKEYNPGLKEALVRLAANAAEDDAFMEAAAKRAAEGFEESFPVKELAAMDTALAKRVIKHLFFKAGLTEDIAAAHLNALLAAVKARRGGKLIEFPGGYRAKILRGYVLFLKPGE